MSESAGDEPVARLENVALSYGDVTVFDELSLEIPCGGVTAVVGPNGAGKSTLVRIVAGVLSRDAGRRVVPTGPERPIGFLPQSPRFRPAFTVEETVQFYEDLLSVDGSVDRVVEQVGLDPVRNRRVASLSGGMRRLLGVAVSLLGDPALVVLDEPTSGLDPRMQRHVFGVVDTISTDERAVLLTTHNLEGAERADRVVALDRGAIVVDEPPDEFVKRTEAASLTDALLEVVPDESVVQSGREQR